MSLPVLIASLAILATLAAAFLQPIVAHWLTPKQKLRLDVAASIYEIPPAVSREMSKYYYFTLQRQANPIPEFGEFLKIAEHYRTYFDVTISNSGKSTSRNVILGCKALSKYVLITSRNRAEYRPDQIEYPLGDLQPSEKIKCQIWSSSYFTPHDFSVLDLFTIRDDQGSSKQIVLRRIYDRTSHYLIEKDLVNNFASMLKWTMLPLLFFYLLAYVIITIIHRT